MKFINIATASAFGLAVAAPSAPQPTCTPATYECTSDQTGWEVCNTSGTWVFAGSCPPNTVCKFYPQNKSPYCVPPNVEIS